VSNITDIDDKIIDRATRENRPWLDIAQKCEHVWFESMARLGVKRPTDVPRATEYVEQIVGLIANLVAKDAAYRTDDGIYMNTGVVSDYGLLAHQSLDEMLTGGGDRNVFGADQKKHPADFVLWKFSKPGEPAWPSPWGDGRPGWHSECVVMSLELLGEGFDLHCGGADLRFPHHENERAQAVALGKDFAHHWMHNGFVVDTEGEKMSKSLGNVTNLPDLLDRYDARAYRMLLLQTHYRSPVKVGLDNIDASVNALAGIDSFAARTSSLTATPDVATLDAFRAAMNDDLNTPVAMGVLFDAVRRANIAVDAGDSQSRLHDFAALRSGGGRPALEEAWERGLDGSATGPVANRVHAVASADGGLTIRAVRRTDPSAAPRGLVTLGLMVLAAAGWSVAGRLPAQWIDRGPRLVPWGLVGAGLVWLLALSPALPGCVLVAAGLAAVIAARRRTVPPDVASFDSTRTFLAR
ncbi:MAG: hypothetical protein EBR23_08630, partial [Planctomycetia bacterium]|nr:hypothetical protein [Planctomycetia bacterium]